MRPFNPILALAPLLACSGGQDDPLPGGGSGGDTDSGQEGRDPRFDALAGALEAGLEGNNATGVSVAIYEDGEITFAEGFGTAWPEAEVPVSPTTLFQIGSTTKMQTAAALMQRVDAGEITLDTTVEESLPGLELEASPGHMDELTLRHLVSHQGGFYDWIDWAQDDDDGLLESYTYGVFAENLWFMSPPGAFWNYSNPNFILAGLITEDLDGERAWPDIVEEDLYGPLGMSRTFLRKSEVEADGDYALSMGIKNLTTGRIGACDMDDITDPGWARPAGLAWSTPSQMMAYADFLMHGDEAVLSEARRQELVTPQVALGVTADDTAYAMGLFVAPGFSVSEAEYVPAELWSHGGNTLWHTSAFYVLPEQDFAISILSNGYGDDWSEAALLALTTLNEDLPAAVAPPEYPWDPDGLDAHLGDYNDPYNAGPMTVSREGDVLFVEFPLLDELDIPYESELEPVSTDIWYLYIQGQWVDLTFRGEEGEPSRFAANRAFVEDREAVVDTALTSARPSEAQVRRWLARLPELSPDPLLLPPPQR